MGTVTRILIAAAVTLSSIPIAVFSPTPAQAAAPLNPNQLIANSLFTAKDSMSVAEIQAFLVSKNSVLANLSPDQLGENANGRSAAQIIWDASRVSVSNYGCGEAFNYNLSACIAAGSLPSRPFTVSLSPKVILVTLQKEQSLITGGYTAGSSTTNNALRAAMGMACPDGAPCDSEYYGFANQVTLGSTALWLQYWRAGNSPYYSNTNPKRRVGDTINFTATLPSVCGSDSRFNNVTIANAATASLYRYTTGCNGHANFFILYQNWFGNPVCTTNLETIRNESGDVSVLFEGKRYPIAGSAAYTAWGLDCTEPTSVSNSVYSTYLVGPTITRVFKEQGGPRVFIAENGVRRHIRTSLYVAALGLQDEQFFELPQGMVERFAQGMPMGFLVKGSDRNEIYLSQARGKYHITDIPALEAWGFEAIDLITLESSYLEDVPTIGNLTTLIKGTGPDIFLATLRRVVYIPSLARVRDWKLENTAVTFVDNAFLESLPKSGSLSRLAKGSGSTVFYIENGRRFTLSSASQIAPLSRQFGDTTPMADRVITSLTNGGSFRGVNAR
jgi:hypothetical protein